MKQDLRKPTLVVVGAWNLAILRPGWILKHLFAYDERQRVPVAQVFDVGMPPIAAINFVGNLGFRAVESRLEFYLQEVSDDAILQIEVAAKRAISCLPHTPLAAFGVNFLFSEDDPSEALLDALVAKDTLRQHYLIKAQDLVAQIDMQDGATLNFVRHPTPDQVLFNFNYDKQGLRADNAEQMLTGAVRSRLDHAQQLLKTVYELESTDTIKFTCPDGDGGVQQGD